MTEFINEDIRKFAAAALIHVGHAIFKTTQNDAPLLAAVEKGIDIILQGKQKQNVFDKIKKKHMIYY